MTPQQKRWRIYPGQPALSQKLAAHLSLTPVISQILLNRGIKSLTEAKQFLSPDYRQPATFPETWLDQAIELIESAIRENKKILVYGDYDVDGITSTAIIVSALRSFGGKVSYHIPNRFTDGYGLNASIVKRLIEDDIELLITLDCGISNFEEIRQIKSATRAKVITLDHHTVPDRVPATDVIINPKALDPNHPFYTLCTAGISYNFIEYYCRSQNKPLDPESFLDLAALGTIADVAPLLSENRWLVYRGLQLLSQKSRLGIRALLEVAKYEKPDVLPRDVEFVIDPRLNAAGRLTHATICVELLITNNVKEAEDIAQKLNSLNDQRRTIGAGMLEESLAILELSHHEQKVIVLAGENWHSGVIGITASQLVSRYAKPAVVMSFDHRGGKGSARSVGTVNIYSLLKDCSDYFQTFGGHREAAGFSILPENISPFMAALKNLSREKIDDNDLKPILDIDCQLRPDDMRMELAVQIQNLAPFGQGNRMPVFYCNELKAVEFKRVGDGRHLKARFSDLAGKMSFDAIGFDLAEKMELLYKDHNELVFGLEINQWNGRETLQLQLIDLK